LEQGDVAGAQQRLGESLAMYIQVGRQTGIAETQVWLGHARFAASDITEARTAYLAALHLERGLQSKQRTAAGLEGLAKIALWLGNPERAARLLGAAAQALVSVEVAPMPLPPHLQAEREQVVAHARQILGEAVWEAAFAAGRELSLDESLAE
jgi:hypothetical protein